MHWFWLAVGACLMLIISLAAYLIFRYKEAVIAQPADFVRPLKMHLLIADTLQLLKSVIRINQQVPEHSWPIRQGRMLTVQLLRLRKRINAQPWRIQEILCRPQYVSLAQRAVDDGTCNASDLLSSLAASADILSSSAIAEFPLIAACAVCQRLQNALRCLLLEKKEQRKAQKLLNKLQHTANPLRLLEKARLETTGLSLLLKALGAEPLHPLLSVVRKHLLAIGIEEQEIIKADAQQQLLLSDEVRQCAVMLDKLALLDWLPQCASADPLHALLQTEPSGTYLHMDAPSQLQLRLSAEAVSRHAHMPVELLLDHALELCRQAETDAAERYVGFWLQDPGGILRLLHVLRSRRGWLYACVSANRSIREQVSLWSAGLLAGFVFLQSRGPAAMLPFFALAAGNLIRWGVFSARRSPLPAMNLTALSGNMRTLVVVPAVLHDEHEAIRMVRKLKVIKKALKGADADFLLLGDFPSGMMAVSSTDAVIIQAASSAVCALGENSRVMYLQRARSWDGSRHCYSPRGGHSGAVSEICRLIVQGECRDVIAASTAEPASFERKYAYVLSLSPDSLLTPGSFDRLLSCITHPLCTRHATSGGWRGFSILTPENTHLYDGVGLIRPDVYLEATENVASDLQDAEALLGELAGHTAVPGAYLQRPDSTMTWNSQYASVYRSWRLWRWQLPHVQTAAGLIRNPLSYAARFRLREGLREALIPLARCVLLVYGIFFGNWPILLLVLVSPDLLSALRNRRSLLHAICRLALLPTKMTVNLCAVWDALRSHQRKQPSWLTAEVWAQGLAATILTALGIAFPASAIPAFSFGVLFACFPLAHRYMDSAIFPDDGLDTTHDVLLDTLAASTWQYFSNASAQHALPYTSIQFDPPLGASLTTTPHTIGAELLATVCAKELGFLSAPSAAVRIRRTTEQLAGLPMPFGVPCAEYALPSLTVLDARAEAGATGFFMAALMTTAQALRCWLPELPDPLTGLSGELEQIMNHIDLSLLYDPEAGLFHRSIDENGQGADVVPLLTDETMLLAVAACARSMIPPSHFQRLQQPCVRLRGETLPLSLHGDACAHLLPTLFFPANESLLRPYLQQMLRCGQDGLWGQSACACWQFDPQLHYQQKAFGVPDAALSGTASVPVFPAYAAALCLPFMPREAADCLLQHQARGALGQYGFMEAVDLTAGGSLISMQDTFHQGLILMSVAHLLADAPIQRFFTSLPEVEACLPLLKTAAPPVLLPPLKPSLPQDPAAAEPAQSVDASKAPASTAVLGDASFCITANAAHFSTIRCGGIPLTRSSHQLEPCGLQIYLKDEGRSVRLGDPRLSGTTVFAAGEIRYEQLLGSLKAELIVTADSVRQRALHMLILTNLSTSDRIIEAASFLLPGSSVPANTLEADRPESGKLCLHARCCERSLYHTFSASVPPQKLHVCTDAISFLGRNGSLHRPRSLDHASADQFSVSTDLCLSFRSQFHLGGRGQLTLWFTTSMKDTEPPALSELSGLRSLSAMQHKAAAASISISPAQLDLAAGCFPLLNSANGLFLHLANRSGLAALTDLIAVLRWYLLHGYAFRLHAACDDSLIADIRQHCEDMLPEDCISFVSPEEAERQPYAWHLYADIPLPEQLAKLHPTYPECSADEKAPIPALLPEQALTHTCAYGGFDPDTGDYVIQLQPGETTPAAWLNRHQTRACAEAADESALRTPFEEQVFLQLEDGTWLSPSSIELPRSVRIAAAHASWEAWSDTLDVRLTASCVPGQRCAQRILRLRNATSSPLTVIIHVAARLSQGGPLLCAPGILMTDRSDTSDQAWFGGEGWEARRIHSFGLAGSATSHQPDSENGTTAVLTRKLMLAPQASGKAVWFSGAARTLQSVMRTLTVCGSSGASALLRSAQIQMTQQLDRLTVATPEDTFDVLVNSILPRQAVKAQSWARIAALNLLDPSAARQAILHAALRSSMEQVWLPLLLLTDEYIHTTGDTALLNVYLSSKDQTLLDWFRYKFLSSDPAQLMSEEADPNTVFTTVLAAQALNRLQPDEALQGLSQKLLNAADTYFWHGDRYGTPLCLTTQCLAMLAFGPNHRTRRAMDTCWNTLYDRPHGLIRKSAVTDAPPLPGSPENGGMTTLDAVLAVYALFAAGQKEEAFELLRALNPLHHTDTPERTEVFRCAPYLLHGGMYAAPLEAGRAVPEGGDAAASLFYACLMKYVIGLQRSGSSIRLTPCVPEDWEEFTLTIREGSSTWRISAERRLTAATLDGNEIDPKELSLVDDGGIHQIRLPLK